MQFYVVHSLFDKNISISGATIPDQSGSGIDVNEGELRIPQNSCITWTTPLDCLVSYRTLVGGRSYPSSEKQSVYSRAPYDWAILKGRF